MKDTDRVLRKIETVLDVQYDMNAQATAHNEKRWDKDISPYWQRIGYIEALAFMRRKLEEFKEEGGV